MIEYFGTVAILIYDKKDLPQDEYEHLLGVSGSWVTNLKEKKNWDNFDIVVIDKGDGSLQVLKDNTSKFSVPKYQIQG